MTTNRTFKYVNNVTIIIKYITLPGFNVLNFEFSLFLQLKNRVMRTTGIVLLIIGIIGILVFGIQSFQQAETFNFLGINIGVSQANWIPIILSTIVFVIGIVIIRLNKRAPAYNRRNVSKYSISSSFLRINRLNSQE